MAQTVLDELASGAIQAPDLVKTLAADLKAAQPLIGPLEGWALDALQRWLATKIPANVAAMLVNEIRVQIDLTPAP